MIKTSWGRIAAGLQPGRAEGHDRGRAWSSGVIACRRAKNPAPHRPAPDTPAPDTPAPEAHDFSARCAATTPTTPTTPNARPLVGPCIRYSWKGWPIRHAPIDPVPTAGRAETLCQDLQERRPPGRVRCDRIVQGLCSAHLFRVHRFIGHLFMARLITSRFLAWHPPRPVLPRATRQ